MRRLIPLIVVAVLLAGCGGKKAAPPIITTTTTTPKTPSPASLLGPGGKAIYIGGPWAVVTKGDKVITAHLVAGKWVPERSSVVKLTILGPHPGQTVASIPQVAFAAKAAKAFVEEGLWVDGRELLEKGGGNPNDLTIYGAPSNKLKPGLHTAVGYARTATSAAAVAWTFRVV